MTDMLRPAAEPPLLSEGQTLDRLSLIGQEITASFAFPDVFAAIERHLGDLLDAATLYIGLLDESGQWIDVPLFVDGGRRSTSRRFRVDDPVRPASRAVREAREILSEKTLEEAIRNDLPGTVPTLSALFRPLVVQGRTIGVMSVQSGRAGAYGDRERLIFRTLCSYAAVALSNAENFRRLAAMESLEILGQVGQEVTANLELDGVAATLERHMHRLFDVAGFRLAVLDGEHVRFPIAIQAGIRAVLPSVARTDRASPDARAIASGQEIEIPEAEGSQGASLHRPLLTQERMLGALALIAHPGRGFDEREVLLFRTLSSYVAIALANAAALAEARFARAEADAALAALSRAQQDLVRAETMASLGQLVAGVAHEVNTPVGTALTVASSLQHLAQGFRARIEEPALRRSDLIGFAEATHEASRQLAANLTRASDLVRRFKDVAAERGDDDERRRFSLGELVGAALARLREDVAERPIRLEADVPDELVVDSYPGVIGQILADLLANALGHAFPGGRSGIVTVQATKVGRDRVAIGVRDDGIGIAAGDRGRLFEPFFTTARDRGGAGLSLHIAYNLASRSLRGRLSWEEPPGGGSLFRLEMPLQVAD